MKITFQTKKENNRQQQEEFLKLSSSERVVSFYNLMEQLKDFSTKKREKKTVIF